MTLSVGDKLAKAFTPDAPTPKSIKGVKTGELNIQLIEGEEQHLFEVERIDYLYPTSFLVKLREID